MTHRLCASFLFLQAVPYVGTIPGGLKQDMAVFVQGTVPADGNKYVCDELCIKMEKSFKVTAVIRKACTANVKVFVL